MVNDMMIENARIGFKNFSGKEGKFNNAGNRNFCVFLDDPVIVEDMIRDGWNVRFLNPRDNQEEPQAYIQVAVSYVGRPPKIFLISGRSKTALEEEDINILDWAEIKTVDLVIHPYSWDVGGRSGIKAYLKDAYITIVEDRLAEKYRDVPDSAQSAMTDDGYGY